MLLMILIFICVIIFTVLPSYSNYLSNLICKQLFKLTDEELNLRVQIKDLKAEQESVSMADEFAKYMKLQRKIDKNLSDIKSKGSPRQQNIAFVKLAVKIAIHVLHVLTMLSIVVMYRSEPLLSLPTDWFTPFNKLIAIPTGISGGIGIGCWILVCNTVIFRVKRLSYLLEG